MQRRSYELWWALGAMIAITLLYVGIVARLNAPPRASGLLGHSLGIAGFVLMLMTETLYSLRKRSHSARWGRPSSWLRFHIFTGLVGPFLVLFHTSWRFSGLAGMVTVLTISVVLSGIIGRYIYTAVPRTASGVEIGSGELDHQIAAAEAALERLLDGLPETDETLVRRLVARPSAADGGPLAVLGRIVPESESRLAWWRYRRRLDSATKAQARELQHLLREHRALRRQAASLVTARRMLAAWHTVHIPIGVVLFTAAFVHIGAAIYYATLLK